MKPCTSCDRPARPRQRTCSACHTAYMRAWRRKQSIKLNKMKKVYALAEKLYDNGRHKKMVTSSLK